MPQNFKTVLCGTDFSEESYEALDRALAVAQNAGGTLIVVHAVHVPTGEMFTDTEFTLNFTEVEERVQGMLERLHQERLAGYQPCQLRVELGDPAQVLLRVAEENAADLIVTATHGRSGLAHLVMGSVAEKVIRHAPCPVLVIRVGATGISRKPAA